MADVGELLDGQTDTQTDMMARQTLAAAFGMVSYARCYHLEVEFVV